MRFMVMVKATKNSEAGVMPSEKLLAEMGRFNEELAKAGVLLAGEGLQPTAKGARVRFSHGKRTVVDGPFAETKELIAGYWLWQVASKEEAIEWVKRCPDPMPGEEAEIEIRQVFEAEDFGAEFTPELRAQEERLRAQAGERAKSPPAKGRSVPATDAYLFFDGNCAEAMRFYERVLGGTLDLMTHAESPIANQAPPGSANRVMHARLAVGGRTLMASDTMPGQPYAGMNGFSLALAYSTVAEARRVFDALAEGSRITMPFQETFWAEAFGMLVDRFGTPWMVNGNLKRTD